MIEHQVATLVFAICLCGTAKLLALVVDDARIITADARNAALIGVA